MLVVMEETPYPLLAAVAVVLPAPVAMAGQEALLLQELQAPQAQAHFLEALREEQVAPVVPREAQVIFPVAAAAAKGIPEAFQEQAPPARC